MVSTYFLPATAGGDHSFKFGYRWRNAHSTSSNHRGGFIEARFTNGIANAADIWRDSNQITHLDTHAFYVQDTYTRNRLTINLGLRFDRQDDSAQAGLVPENPFFPQLMPSVDFQGADAGVVWNDLSPRIGATYDLTATADGVLVVVRDLLRPDVARPAFEPAGRHQRGIRALPVDRHQRRSLRAARRSQHLGAVPQQEHRLRSGEPDQHHFADSR